MTEAKKIKAGSGALNVDASKKAQKTAKIVRLVITYLFLAVMAVIIIFPFYWMII